MILNPRPYTIKRFERTIANGVITETESDDFTVSGNLQPMNDRELAVFGDGLRSRGGWKFYTAPGVDLRIGGLDRESEEDTEPDRLVMSDGRFLFVHGVEDYSAGLIPHRKWLLLEAETETEAFDPDA